MPASNNRTPTQDVQISVVGDDRDLQPSNNAHVLIDHQQRNLEVSVGTPVVTGRLAWVRNTYAAHYNFAVRNYHSIDGSVTKKQMRGGRFFLFRYVILLALGIGFVCGITSPGNKGLLTVPILLAILYTGLSIFNIYIYCRNGSLIHERMFWVKDSALPGFTNEFFKIPINARIKDRRIRAIIGENLQAVVASTQEHDETIDSVKLMAYRSSYLPYTGFPHEAIVHVILFWVVVIIGAAV